MTLSDLATEVMRHMCINGRHAAIVLQSCCMAHGGVSLTSEWRHGRQVYILSNKLGQTVESLDGITLSRAFLAGMEGSHMYILLDGVRFCKLNCESIDADLVQGLVNLHHPSQ
jgi:hypothetical protein